MRSTRVAVVAVVAFFVMARPAWAEMFSKAYAFKPNTVLQVGATLEAGLRLDTIEFVVTSDDGSPSGAFAGAKVRIAISNVGDKSVKVGISLAVTDDTNRLVGVASGGTKLVPLRADRQMPYVLDVDGANSELPKGTAFRISIESK